MAEKKNDGIIHTMALLRLLLAFSSRHVSRRWWATLVGAKYIMDIDFPAMIHLMLSE